MHLKVWLTRDLFSSTSFHSSCFHIRTCMSSSNHSALPCASHIMESSNVSRFCIFADIAQDKMKSTDHRYRLHLRLASLIVVLSMLASCSGENILMVHCNKFTIHGLLSLSISVFRNKGNHGRYKIA
jgi:hypothetical protein